MASRILLSLFSLALLGAVVRVDAKEHVPVLVWNTNQAQGGLPAVSALQYINYNAFQSKYLQAFQPKNILLFIQDALSIEDLSSHADEFKHVNQLMQAGHSLYLPNVEDAAHLAHDLPTHGYTVQVLEPGVPVAGLNLKEKDNNLVVVKLPSTLTNPSRTRALQKADEVIGNVISKIGQQREFTVVFTGQKPSVEDSSEQYQERIRVSRSLQQAPRDDSYPLGFHYTGCVFILFFKDMVLNYYDENSTPGKPSYSVAINESKSLGAEMNGDCSTTHQSILIKYNDIVIREAVHSQLKLQFHFQIANDEWEFTNVQGIFNSSSTVMDNFKPLKTEIVGIPLKMSYSCSQKIVLRAVSSNTKASGGIKELVLNGVQMQPGTDSLPNKKFSGAWDCVGFFTVPILASVLVSLLLVTILTVGMYMLADIKTMDRFDDPKRPSIMVPTAE